MVCISNCLNPVYPQRLSKIFKSPPSENFFLLSSSDFSLNPIGQEDITTRKADSTNHHIGFLCQDLSLMNLNIPVYWPASLDVQVKCVERKKKKKEKPECDSLCGAVIAQQQNQHPNNDKRSCKGSRETVVSIKDK